MNYATETDMRARYREDLLRPLLAVPRSDEPDTRKLNRALTDASALIDSYLSAVTRCRWRLFRPFLFSTVARLPFITCAISEPPIRRVTVTVKRWPG